MAKATKLESGNWICQAYLGKDKNGKVIRKAFTASTKKQAEYLAAEYLMNNAVNNSCDHLLFKDAVKKYIDNRESVLSPSTIRGYRQIAKVNLSDIDNIYIDKITQENIQTFINDLCEDGKAPKTVRNIHGLISTVMDDCRPEFKLKTSLPKKQKPVLHIPTDDEVVKVITQIRKIKDYDLLKAVLLAAYGPMRRSEVCALNYEDIKDGIVHVNKAMVHNSDNDWVIKLTPKSDASDRYIPFPDFVLKELKGSKGRVVNIFPDYISDHFARAVKNAGCEHFRYHDLRHYSASIQHALGIPDAYIMERGGWESDATLKEIYRHALSPESKKNNDKINDYFSKLNK